MSADAATGVSRKRFSPDEVDNRPLKRLKTESHFGVQYSAEATNVPPALTALPASSSMMIVENPIDWGTKAVELVPATPAEVATPAAQFLENVPMQLQLEPVFLMPIPQIQITPSSMPLPSSFLIGAPIDTPTNSSQFLGDIPMSTGEAFQPPTFHLYQRKDDPQPIDDDVAPYSFFPQVDCNTPIYVDDPDRLADEMDMLSFQSMGELPHTCENYCALGAIYLADRKYPKAQEKFQKAIELDPNHTPAKLGLASCFFYAGEYAKTLDLCLPIEKTNQYWNSIQFKIGCCYLKLDNLPEAIKYFSLVHELHTFFWRAQYNIACCYYNQKEYAKASDHFEKATPLASPSWYSSAHTPKLNAALYYSGLCYIFLNKPEMAIRPFSIIPAKSRYSPLAKAKSSQFNNNQS